MKTQQSEHAHASSIGIGSYAYRYAIGFNGFTPARPMNIFDFLTSAHQLGLNRVQLCENLAYADLPESTLREARDMARELNLAIEVGMRDLTREHLDTHLQIADLLDSRFLRCSIHQARLN